MNCIPLFYQDAVVLVIPIAEIRAVAIEGRSIGYKATVTLLDGTELKGELHGYTDKVTSVTGRTKVEGYPAEVPFSITSVDTIAFSKDESGKVVAEIRETKGQTRVGIEEIRLNVEVWDELTAARVNRINVRSDDATLEIPITDVAYLSFAGDSNVAVVSLRSGRSLKGSLGFLMTGSTTERGSQVRFIVDANRVQSIEFR